MNCEFFNSKDGKCLIDGGDCRAVDFCRILGVEKPAGSVPLVKGLIDLISEKQASSLSNAINKFFTGPALNR